MVNLHLLGGTLGFYLEDTGIGGGGTYGTRLMNATPANTKTYPFGDYYESFPIPAPKSSLVDRGVFNSFDYGDLKSGAMIVEFLVKYTLIEGLCLYFPLGKEFKSGSTPDITHTLTGITPSDDVVQLPSRTVHIDCPSLTTPKIIDIAGCVTRSMDIAGSVKDPSIFATESLVGQRITDENATHDLLGVASAGSEDDAQDFTNDPAYGDNHATELTPEDHYYLNDISHEGNSIKGDYVAWNINILNEFVPRRANRVGTDNYGRTINNYVGAYYLKKRRYTVTLQLLATDETMLLWDRMQQQTQSNDLIFEFVRKRASDQNADTITWTFDTSVCPVTDVSGMIAYHLGNDLNWAFSLQPKTLVNCVVIDDVNEYQELHE